MPLSVLVRAARPLQAVSRRKLGFLVAVAGAAVMTLATAGVLVRLSEASAARIDGPIAGLLPQLWPSETAPEPAGDSVPNAIDEPAPGPPYKPE